MSDDPPEKPKDEFTKFVDHMKKIRGGKGPPECPICGCVSWIVDGPNDLVAADAEAEAQGKRVINPMIFMVCKNCFLVQQFSWLRINGEVSDG
jgi:hypothetical protein